jgi:hypothetical protein
VRSLMRRGVMRRDLMLQSPRLIKRDGGIGVGAIAGQRLSKVGALGVGASSSRHRLKTAGVGRMRRGQTPTSGAASGTGGLTEPQASEKFDDAIRPKRPSRALGRATGWNVARDPHDGAVYTPPGCKLVSFTGIKCLAGRPNSSGITERSGDCRRLSSGAPRNPISQRLTIG